MPSYSRLALLVFAALSTTACSVGPTYVAPSPSMPTAYLGQAAVERRTADDRIDLATWWNGFNDPVLSRLVETALENNLDLAQASARIIQARAGLGAANAALLPSGAIGGQAARVYQSVETPLGRVLNANPGFDRNGSSYELNANASWELDLFGGLRHGRDAALADYQASEAGGVATRLAVAAQTADLYLRVRGLQASLAIAGRQVASQRSLLDTINQLFDKGLAAELQVRQVEGELAQVEASVPVLNAALEATMNALDVMLAAPLGAHRAELAAGGAGATPAAPGLGVTGTPGDLLRRRPDILVAERRLAASNARIGAAIAEYYPKVSLSGLIGSATSIASGNLFSSGANQAAGVLGLRWRLFDVARIDAQIQQTKGEEAERLAAYRLAVLRATEDVENAFTALVNRESQAALLTRSVNALTRARDTSWQAYQGGIVSLIEVLQADDALLRASMARADAQTESARAAVAAFKALGGGWAAAGVAGMAPTAIDPAAAVGTRAFARTVAVH